MSDIFKSNPIAIRHCLLYEFLQGKPVEEAFSDFCKAVGNDVIKKESFEFWFDKFFWGIFDDANEPIADIKEALRSDKYALRACILYESLKYKLPDRESSTRSLWPKSNSTNYEVQSNPSFAMYKMFCKVVGEAVMEYQEFEFWFYRFYNGGHELKYERDKDEKIYELMDMPIDVMKDIVEYLDIFDRMKLAKKSRSLQTFVEDQKLFHHTLRLTVSHDITTVSLSNSVYIAYFRHSVGCTKSFKKRVTRVRRVDHWKQALLDFKSILKNPKLHLDTLEIGLYTNDEHVLNDLEDELKFTHYLNVKDIILKEHPSDKLLSTISSLKPGYLSKIDFGIYHPKVASMNTLFEMEQWKQAKYFEMDRARFIWPLHHLYHLKEFAIILERLSVEHILQLKEILFNSPYFGKCLITVDDGIDTNAIEEGFGVGTWQDENNPASNKMYRYPIGNSTDYFEIKVKRHLFEVTKKKR